MTRAITITALAVSLMLGPGCVPPIPGAPEGEMLGILVTPAEPVVTVGGESQLVAYAFYESGDSVDVTASVEWFVVSGDAVAVRDDLDHEGVAVGLRAGTSSVVANLDGVSSEDVIIRVTDAEVVGLSINPNSLDLKYGGSAWLTAMADFSDGTRGDFSGGVRWITGDPAIVTVAADGRATGESAGLTQVRAEYEGVIATPVDVTVLDDDASSDDPGDENDDPFGDDDDDTGIGDDDDDTGDTGDDDDDVTDPEGDDDDDETGDDGMPNLEVTYFEAYVGDGETYYFIDVTNSGDGHAGGFYVDLFTDPWWAPEVGDDGDTFMWINGLAAGETVYADFGIGDSPWWGWESYVLLDTTEEVEESDEGDNVEGPLEV